MRRGGIESLSRAILPVATDTEQLLVVVMGFVPLYIFILVYSDTVNIWRGEAMWNYTVEWAAMNLQRCQFQTRNIQSRGAGIYVRRNGSLKNANRRIGMQREAEMFQVEAGCSFEQIKREGKQTTAVGRKRLWRAQFGQTCVELSLLAKSLENTSIHFQ